MNTKFVKNASWIIGGKLARSLIGFVVSIFTAKMLGPTNFGVLGYITSVTTILTSFCTLGLDNIIVKELIQKKDEGTIIGTAITLELISSFISYGVAMAVIILSNTQDKIFWICGALQGASLLLTAFDNIDYWYQSKFQSKTSTIISLIGYLVLQAYKVILLIFGKSVAYFAFANTLDFLVIAVLYCVSYALKKGARWKFSFETAKILLRQSWVFILSGFMTAAYNSIDKIMLKEMLNDTAYTGYYDVAYSVSNVWVFVLVAIKVSFNPLIYQAYGDENNPELFRIRTRQLYFITFWLSFSASVCIDVIAPFFIRFSYGEAYLPAIIPTMILVWNLVFAHLGTVTIVHLTCMHQQKYIIGFTFLTLITNVCMNAILIPRFNIIGATVATVCSQFFVSMIAPLFFRKTRYIPLDILRAVVFRGIEFPALRKELKEKIFRRSRRKKELLSEEAVQGKSEYVDTEKCEENFEGKIEENIENKIERDSEENSVEKVEKNGNRTSLKK